MKELIASAAQQGRTILVTNPHQRRARTHADNLSSRDFRQSTLANRYANKMWRSRIFWRLFGAYCMLLIVSLALLGWFLITRMQSHLLQETRHHLEVKTLLISDLVRRYSGAEYQEQINRVARESDARITLIQAGGKVIADSDEQPAKMDNHGDRPEVQQAETQGFGVSTRYSDTLHQPMMYVARRNDEGLVRFVRIALPLNTVAAEINWLHRVVWTGTGITSVIALILSMLVVRSISVPLAELAGAADSIARGNYGRKISISSRDEIGALAASFNSMSEACAAHIAQLDREHEQLRAIFRSMVEGVVVLNAEKAILFANDAASHLLGSRLDAVHGQEISQVFHDRQLNDAVEKVLASDEPYRCELEWAGAETRALGLQGARLSGEPHQGAVLVFHDITHLRKLETVRQDFVANVSHELKTPLAVIQATVETLLDGALDDVEHNVRFLELIREHCDRLYRLVQDLLALGRIESSDTTLDPEPIELESAIEACIDRQTGRAVAMNLGLTAEPPGQPVIALADSDAVAEILDNLVDNALKYTPTGGKIVLRWNSNNGEAIVQVADTGVGISANDLPRVFERFYRVDKARSRELGGTGLGLSIVKHLALALGGSVTATSELGRGSVFSVHLPLVRAAQTRKLAINGS